VASRPEAPHKFTRYIKYALHGGEEKRLSDGIIRLARMAKIMMEDSH